MTDFLTTEDGLGITLQTYGRTVDGIGTALGYAMYRYRYLFSAIGEARTTPPSSSPIAELLETSWALIAQAEGRHQRGPRLSRGGQSALLHNKQESAIVLLTNNRNTWGWEAAAATPEALTRTSEMLEKLLPSTDVDSSCVRFTFWHNTAHGAHQSMRDLQCPPWTPELAQNYLEVGGHHTACPELQELIHTTRPDGYGSLVLFHGSAGTGKSYAIRTLAHSWKGWCDTHYVLDPEVLFKAPEYMTQVLLGGDDPDEAEDRWRLVILEDADEFLAVDAKQIVGQSLARLLNVTDGIIGQGARLIVLITTNEPLNKIHEAIGREGRCLAKLHFKPLQPQAATAWLQTKGRTVKEDHYRTLAELYAIANGKHQIGKTK